MICINHKVIRIYKEGKKKVTGNPGILPPNDDFFKNNAVYILSGLL